MRESKTLIAAASLLVASTTFFTLGACVEAPKDRLPSGFVYLDSKKKQEAINLKQVMLVTPTWDIKIPLNKRTSKNMKWTYVKTTDNVIFTLKETMRDFMGRARNSINGS